MWIKLNVIHFSDRKNPFIWIHCNKTMVEAHLFSNSIVPYFFRWFLFHHEDDHVIYVLNHLQFIFRQCNSIYLGITLGQKFNVEKLACKEAKKKQKQKKWKKSNMNNNVVHGQNYFKSTRCEHEKTMYLMCVVNTFLTFAIHFSLQSQSTWTKYI